MSALHHLHKLRGGDVRRLSSSYELWKLCDVKPAQQMCLTRGRAQLHSSQPQLARAGHSTCRVLQAVVSRALLWYVSMLHMLLTTVRCHHCSKATCTSPRQGKGGIAQQMAEFWKRRGADAFIYRKAIHRVLRQLQFVWLKLDEGVHMLTWAWGYKDVVSGYGRGIHR